MNRREMNDSPGRGRGRRRSWPRWAPALAALALMGLLATACGGGPSHARARGPSPVEAALAYARCMRAHGVPDFPDPDSNGQFHVDPPNSASRSQVMAANHACQHLLQAADAARHQHMFGQLVQYAQCMRAHGVPNFPDPQTTNGGIGGSPGMGFDLGSIKVHSPQFQAADHACHSLQANAKG